jgi:hypothetical protein
MSIDPERTEFGFSTEKFHPEHIVRLALDQARRLIVFLNPRNLQAEVELGYKEHSPFLDLLALAKGKLILL